jgi:hypothetical protein
VRHSLQTQRVRPRRPLESLVFRKCHICHGVMPEDISLHEFGMGSKTIDEFESFQTAMDLYRVTRTGDSPHLVYESEL